MEYLILSQSELPTIDGAHMCEGSRYDEANISLIFVDVSPGQGARLHMHPYREVFIVHAGQARFTIGPELIDVVCGQVVMVAAGVPHKFVNSGSGRLLQTDIHLSSQFETEWLES